MLLKGENILISADDVYFRHKTEGHVYWRRGKFYITNYQVLFTAEQGQKVGYSSSIQELGSLHQLR
jgi:hypothetical protein